MDRKHLHTLEFPKILERLAEHTAFSASRDLALALMPADSLEEARRRQTETIEAIRLLDTQVPLSVGGARDVRPLLADCRRGASLTPAQLLEIRATLLSGRALRNTLMKRSGECPSLADIAGRIEECAHVSAEIARCIDERAEVMDSASPALTRIRRELRQAHERVLEYLRRLMNSPETAGYLQESLITQRSGRYVIPLKAEFKGRIPGLVHDQSASGATLFIEPLATVELNNQWKTLQIEEENEVRRILAGLSELVAQESVFIEHTVEALAELDLVFAKAKYAQATRSVAPELLPFSKPRGPNALPAHPGSIIDLRQARHPLLNPETVVPINVHLGPDYFILVITGPNTGGKTVSLKTVGLLTAMAQAGLAIPAQDGSRLSVFESIFADIGDEQSIEQNLSTFSSHMTNLVNILGKANSRSLVLLDELGAGTDPEEGSALARSILSHLVERSITALATTHYSELKIYAHSTPGVRNASVEFDLETLSPTYELTIGLPGRSNALSIARRLGLPASIVDRASRLISPDSLEAESLLTRIKEAYHEAEEARRQAQAARQEAEDLRADLGRKLRDIEVTRHEILEAARAEARQELAALKAELDALRAEAQAQLRAGASRSAVETLAKLDETVDAMSEEWQPLEQALPSEDDDSWRPPQLGDTVWVDDLKVLAEVTELAGDEVEVQAGVFRARVPARSVQVRHPAPAPSAASAPRFPLVPAGPRVPLELDLRGLRAEEALSRLDKYLNDAFLSELPWVRVVHGKGTGALRQAVRERLQGHPLVTSFRAGESNEGGDGVTIVTLGRV